MTVMRHRLGPAVLLLALVASPAAFGQIQIKTSDTTFLKFGLLLQTQADELQDATSRGYSQNLFIRRARLLLGGQLSPKVTFFAETDAPNLGKSLTAGTKNTQPSIFVQDAYVEYKVNDALSVDAGLMLISPSRNGLQSAASLLPIDYGPHTFLNSAPTQSAIGRDSGVQAKGYLLNKKLEYRAGVFAGMRDAPDREFRTTARLQYNFFDTETGYFYPGTYFGKKKIVAVGAGIDRQHKYLGYAGDVFVDMPVGTGAVTFQLDHILYDGSTFLTTLPKQHDTLLEAGYLIGHTRFMPVIQFARKDISGRSLGDEERYGAGINYLLSGQNANLKLGVTRIKVDGLRDATQATVQFQIFYF